MIGHCHALLVRIYKTVQNQSESIMSYSLIVTYSLIAVMDSQHAGNDAVADMSKDVCP